MEETEEATEMVLDPQKRLYEAMFLVDSAQAGSDWDGILAAINRVLERAEVDVVSIRKWADRKLAYEIGHKGRGTYILAFFNADPLKIASIEKDVNLSEQIARVLVLSTEGRPEECIRRDVSGESKAPTDYVRPGERPARRDSAGAARSETADAATATPQKSAPAPAATAEKTAPAPAATAEKTAPAPTTTESSGLNNEASTVELKVEAQSPQEEVEGQENQVDV